MGLILVFDMDQTILDSSDPYLFERPNTVEGRRLLKIKIKESLNWNVVNILSRASYLRPDKVSAICLLTNNSSTILVNAVDEVLREIIGLPGRFKTNINPGKEYFFDYIMMRQHPSRPVTVDNNPPKRLIDIINMTKYLKMEGSAMDFMKDTYFFDDIPTHVLRSEFNFMYDGKYKDHYITITPPFKKDLPDKTNYDPVLLALSKLDGESPYNARSSSPMTNNNMKGGRYTLSRRKRFRKRMSLRRTRTKKNKK